MKHVLFILVILLYISCNSKTSTEAQDIVTKESEDFAQFDKLFHSDSLFQMSRIKFPIEGHGKDGLKKTDWSRKNWELHITAVGDSINTGNYKHSTVVTDSTVTEKYWLPDSGFSSERRFEKIKGKWYLVYFNDVNL